MAKRDVATPSSVWANRARARRTFVVAARAALAPWGLGLLVSSALLVGCGFLTTEPADVPQDIVGLYVLERAEGLTPPLVAGCRAAGEIFGTLALAPALRGSRQSYSWAVGGQYVCDAAPRRVHGEVLVDAGGWSADAVDRADGWLQFRSGRELGAYEPVLTRGAPVDDNPPAVRVLVSVAGHTSVWRRVRTYDAPIYGVSGVAVDEAGVPVVGAIFEFVDADGVVSGGVSNADLTRPFGTGVAAGPVTVTVSAPAGYRVAPTQANPVVVTAGSGLEPVARFVLIRED